MNSDDFLADVFGIPHDRAAALRLLADPEKRREVMRLMDRVGDVVRVPLADRAEELTFVAFPGPDEEIVPTYVGLMPPLPPA